MPDRAGQRIVERKPSDASSLGIEELLQSWVWFEQLKNVFEDIVPNTVHVVHPESDYLEISMAHMTSGDPYFYGFNLPRG